tara:strand:+ start:937 stop:2247 length:1311 start_codon:yes stop_codon:yes gene_type:complete
MAKFSESFLQQLGRPGFSQGMFNLGQSIGGAQGQIRDQRKKQEFNQLMQQGQQAMASKNPAALANVAQKLGAAGYQKEAQQMMQASREASEKATRVSAGRDMLSGVPLQMRQGAAALADQGLLEQALEARGLAQSRQVELGQQALAKVAGATGAKISEPVNRDRFFRLAKAYQVPPEKAFEIYNQFATAAGGDRTTKGEVVIRDSQGNLFTRASQYDEQGRGREVILPFPNSPKEPVGALTIVSGTTGGGMFDRPEVAGQTTEEQKFNEARVSAVVQLPSLRRSAKNIRESIDLLESGDVTTGGFVRRMSRGLTDFLGKTPKDIGEFETRLGDIVLARLESFTGAISEGERKFLIEQIGSYQASGESNLGRLKVLLEQAEDLMRDGVALATAEDFASYQRSLTQPDLSFIPEAERQEAMEAFQKGEVSVQELRGMY